MLAILRMRLRHMMLVLVLAVVGACTWVWARSAATVPPGDVPVLKVETAHPENAFQLGAVGLSVDANELSSGRLSASRTSLVRLMRLLGASVLRIGGGSVDLSWWTASSEPPPAWATNTVTPAALSTLRGLLSATGWRVLLGVDLGHFEPARAADEARAAQQILGSRLVGVEVGNEPNSYHEEPSSYLDKNGPVVLRAPTYNVGEYVQEVGAYRQALEAAVPGLAVYGPAAGGTRWLAEMGTAASVFTELTEHYYPPNQCATASAPTAPLPTVAELLSPKVREQEDEALGALAQAGALTGRPTRIGETGTGACRGNSSAGPAFASALWSLDWALRAASSGVTGLNFHGHFGVCGPYNQSPLCAPTMQAAQAGEVAAQSEYYGLLAASRLEGGRFVPTKLIASPPLPNLTTWATVAPSGKITIAIDNFATVGSPQLLSIPGSGYTATVTTLLGPSAQATTGAALGDSHVTGSGRWRPRLMKLSRSGQAFRVVVNPASALIVTLTRARSHR